jgi:hypothetical protein
MTKEKTMKRYMVHYWEDGELIGTTDLLGEAEAWILDDDIDGFITDNQTRKGYRFNREIAAKEKN